MLRDIARQLRREGLIDYDLRGVEIQQLVDYHTKHGLRRRHLTEDVFRGFHVLEWHTYAHLGDLTIRSPLTRALGQAMKKRWPTHGFQIAFVLQNNSGFIQE